MACVHGLRTWLAMHGLIRSKASPDPLKMQVGTSRSAKVREGPRMHPSLASGEDLCVMPSVSAGPHHPIDVMSPYK